MKYSRVGAIFEERSNENQLIGTLSGRDIFEEKFFERREVAVVCRVFLIFESRHEIVAGMHLTNQHRQVLEFIQQE